MAWLASDIAAVMWVAVVPAFLAVVLLVVAVREPERSPEAPGLQNRLTFADAPRLPLRYWLVVALGPSSPWLGSARRS